MELKISITLGEEAKKFFSENPDVILHSVNVPRGAVSLAHRTTSQPFPAVDRFQKVTVINPLLQVKPAEEKTNV